MPARGGIYSAHESKGNMSIGENFDARRVQRFLYKGLGLAELR